MHRKQKTPIQKLLKHQEQPSTLQQVLSAYYKTRNKSTGPKYSKSNKISHSNPKGKRKVEVSKKNMNEISKSKVLCDQSLMNVTLKKCQFINENQNYNQKRNLQMKYLKVVEEMFDKFVNPSGQKGSDKGVSYQERLRNSIQSPILYFLGSVVQRMKKQNMQISYLQFIDQCIKVFQRSSYMDVNQFLKLSDEMKEPLKDNTQQLPAVQQKQEAVSKRIRKNSIIKVEQQEKPTQQEVLEPKKQQQVQIKIVQGVTRTPKKVKFQDEIQREMQKKQVSYPPEQREQYLRNLPIISSVESKVIEQTPYISQTLKSEVSSPIQKIDRNVERSITIESRKVNIQNSSVLAQTNTIFSKINSNIDKLSKTLQFPPPSPKVSYQPHSPLHIQNAYKIEHLHQKYGRINRSKPEQQKLDKNEGKQNKTQLFDITKYESNINYDNLRGYRTNKDKTRIGEAEDDRIDRLTAKVEEYINKNTTRIQNNMKNVSRLRKCQ